MNFSYLGRPVTVTEPKNLPECLLNYWRPQNEKGPMWRHCETTTQFFFLRNLSHNVLFLCTYHPPYSPPSWNEASTLPQYTHKQRTPPARPLLNVMSSLDIMYSLPLLQCRLGLVLVFYSQTEQIITNMVVYTILLLSHCLFCRSEIWPLVSLG